MMWVNEIFPPRPRLRWLFITRRLSATSLAGMSRTLVAVGTARLASMFATVRAAAPLSGVTSSGVVEATTPLDADSLASTGTAGVLAAVATTAGCAGTGGAGAGIGAAGALGAATRGAATSVGE